MAKYYSKKKNGISVNAEWAKSVSFEVFKEDSNIAKLSADKQKSLYEEVTGKKAVKEPKK
jgi:hypothetical protein